MLDASGSIGRKLPKSPYQRIEALFRLSERIISERDDLQKIFPDIYSPEFWYWLMWHGCEEYPDVRKNLYPIPSGYLKDRVIGEQETEQEFHLGGLVDWRRVVSCLRSARFNFEKGGSILDFGCGCARLLRFFGLYANNCTFHGADIDKAAVAWCNENIDFASFLTVGDAPPTHYSNGQFNAIYAYSVFTHLPEERHRAWLEELYRISCPGAILVLTTAGRKVIEKVISGQVDMGRPSSDELQARIEEMELNGYLFFPYENINSRDSRNRSLFKEWDLEKYGNSFILESYIRNSWTDIFDLIEFHPAPDDWQDFVVLKRR